MNQGSARSSLAGGAHPHRIESVRVLFLQSQGLGAVLIVVGENQFIVIYENWISSRVAQISNAALRRSFFAYDENTNDGAVKEQCRQETETLAILTGLEIDSAKSGIKPNLSTYGSNSFSKKWKPLLPILVVLTRIKSWLRVNCAHCQKQAVFIQFHIRLHIAFDGS